MKTPTSTWIGSRLIALLLMAFPLVAPGAGAGEPGDTNAIFEAKAKELVAGKSARLEKIMALYVFVRDSIRQVETTFS
jgi:hypothetical protein